jgi:ATP-dependent RNA helicase DDX3X
MTGRTGRIGHHGVAVSFYDPARDEPIASVLTRTLLETDQEVPDFLKPYVPEGVARENLKFEADSDFDEDAGAAGAAGDAGDAGEGWGSGWGTSAEGAEGAEVPNNFGPAQSTDGSVPAW